MIRKPCVAGQFYSAGRQKLSGEIESGFLSRIGPGKLPAPGNSGKDFTVKGGVAPHAGYYFSGHEAAHLYLKLYESGLPDVIVVISPCHRWSPEFPRASVFPGEGWETPLGVCAVDRDICSAMAGSGPFKLDEMAHRHEHSLEVQVPFLQYIYAAAGMGDRLSIVPVCMPDQSYKTAVEAGESLSEVLKTCGRSFAVIASSDFSHDLHLPSCQAPNRRAIDEIINLDFKKMYSVIEGEDVSVCGYGPITACATALMKLYKIKSELLKFGTSADVMPDPNRVVGYAAISFSEAK